MLAVVVGLYEKLQSLCCNLVKLLPLLDWAMSENWNITGGFLVWRSILFHASLSVYHQTGRMYWPESNLGTHRDK